MHSIDIEGCPDAELDFAIGLLLSERKRRETERARVAKSDLSRKGKRDPRCPRCGARLQAAAPASARIVLQSLLTAANRLFPDQVSFASSQKSFASSSSNFLAAEFGHRPKWRLPMHPPRRLIALESSRKFLLAILTIQLWNFLFYCHLYF